MVLGRQPPGYVYGACRDIQVERSPRSSEVRPLGPRLEVIDRLRCLDLHGTHELSGLIRRGEYKIRVDLELANLDGSALVLANVRDDLVLPLQLDLKKSDHAVVLELLANGAHQDRT